MHKPIHYVGLDVHKDSVYAAFCDENGRETSLGSVSNADALLRILRRLAEKADLRICYEAGACGFVLYRLLTERGFDCIVVAPSLIPQKSGDRVKTDKKDALKLARLLRAGVLTAVYVPDEALEAVRDLVRLREEAKADQKRAKNRLGKFLLRNDIRPSTKVKTWGTAHRQWLESIYLEHPAQQCVLREHIAEVDHQTQRVQRLEQAMHAQLPSLPEPMQQVISALVCLHGVAELTAATVVVETGELARFEKAPQLFSYAGMVPSEHSSGGERGRRQGRITKTGNAHLRRVLCEAAWQYRHPPRRSVTLKKRRAGKDPVAIQIAETAHKRLHHRYWQLVQAKKPAPQAAIAVGRELLGFMWALAKTVQKKKAA